MRTPVVGGPPPEVVLATFTTERLMIGCHPEGANHGGFMCRAHATSSNRGVPNMHLWILNTACCAYVSYDLTGPTPGISTIKHDLQTLFKAMQTGTSQYLGSAPSWTWISKNGQGWDECDVPVCIAVCIAVCLTGLRLCVCPAGISPERGKRLRQLWAHCAFPVNGLIFEWTYIQNMNPKHCVLCKQSVWGEARSSGVPYLRGQVLRSATEGLHRSSVCDAFLA